MSYDWGQKVRDNDGMGEQLSETEQKAAFIARTKAARKARFPTQNPILTILGLEQGTYKQYEKRTPLPHRFIPKFCAATGVTVDWLLTGEGKGPVALDTPREAPQRGRKPQRRKAA